MNLWNNEMDEKPTKVHIGPRVVDHCSYKEAVINKTKSKSGVEVVLGTHP